MEKAITDITEVKCFDSKLDEIIVSESRKELVGIIVNAAQAIDIARMFGIVIK